MLRFVAKIKKESERTDKVDIPLTNESATEKLDAIQITIDEIKNTPIILQLETNDALTKVEELRQAILSLNSNITISPNGGEGGQGGQNGSSEIYSVVVEPATTDLGSNFTGNGIINVKPDTTNLGDGFTGKATITVKPDTYDLGSGFHGTGTVSVSGTSPATGTAFARGDWSIGNNGLALGGELGKELIVRDGKFFTIGDKGAEFFRHKKNDIIFNAAQTKALFKYGGIKGANPRGKVYGSGSAFASGNAFSGSSTISGSISKDLWNWLNGNSGNSNNSSNGSSSSEYRVGVDESKDFFDWIEILIDRIERAIEHFEKKVDNVFDSWENRSNALKQQSDLIRQEIDKQQEAYDYYTRYLDFLGLEEKYVNRIKTGEIKISEYDGSFREKIEEYQEFYEKALDCKVAIDDLTVSLSECYQTAFDNVITRYDQLVAVTEHSQAMLDASISQSEAKGYLISQKYYEMQIANEQELIEQQKEKREELIKTRDTFTARTTQVYGNDSGDTENWTLHTQYDYYPDYKDNSVSNIDAYKNIILDSEQINITQETNSQYIPFQMSRYYDGFDLTRTNILIHFVNSENYEDYDSPINVYYNDEKIKFGWLVDERVTVIEGVVKFEIQAIGANSQGEEYIWKTKPCNGLNVLQSLTGDGVVEPDNTWLTSFMSQITTQVSIAQTAADEAKNAAETAKNVAYGLPIEISDDGYSEVANQRKILHVQSTKSDDRLNSTSFFLRY